MWKVMQSQLKSIKLNPYWRILNDLPPTHSTFFQYISIAFCKYLGKPFRCCEGGGVHVNTFVTYAIKSENVKRWMIFIPSNKGGNMAHFDGKVGGGGQELT